MQKLGQELPEMTWEEYERHLEKRLCWHCHRPTHQSHRRQRQCPLCRRKWSYHRRMMEWKLVNAFCRRENPRRASRWLRIAYRTAWNHFMRFECAIRHAGEDECVRFRRYLSARRLPTEGAEREAAVFLYEKFIRPTVPKPAPSANIHRNA